MTSDQCIVDDVPPSERDPLLEQATVKPASKVLQGTVRIAPRLYLSHFLSTWNSRVFEFGAVLYLATIYPGTLLPMSVYAFTRGLSAILFAPAVGQYIDTADRLQVVRVSIVFQRLVVAASCVIFYLLNINLHLQEGAKRGLLALLAFLACVEKLCSIMNLVAVEKDWVVVVAGKNETALSSMNAQMRRIDLLCKLFGPLFIALVDGFSTKAAIIANLAMNVASVIVEYFAIARVYYEVSDLQQPKKPSMAAVADTGTTGDESRFTHDWRHVQTFLRKFATDFKSYFLHRAFLPSFAGALLYLTVLSFAGQMVTYSVSAGYNSTQIGAARTLSVAFEVLATWFAPYLMGKVGPIRAGLWLSGWQVTALTAGIAVFWSFPDKPFISACGLVGGTIVSRVGLRGFDLCTQLIVQEEVEAQARGAFSAVEAAWQNGFELLSYASTMIFFRPEQFKWPAVISVATVATVTQNWYTAEDSQN